MTGRLQRWARLISTREKRGGMARGRHAAETLCAAKILVRFWFQYGPVYKSPHGVVYLDDQAMSAGEAATAWLIELGLAGDAGRGCGLTTKGLELLGIAGFVGYDDYLSRQAPE